MNFLDRFRKDKTENKVVYTYNPKVQQQKQQISVFSEISGHDELKQVFIRMLKSEESSHALLLGPPASGKTLFLLGIYKNLKNTIFIDATNSTGPGMVDKLFAYKNTKIMVIDELEKLSRRDQNVLLNLMETNILSVTKVRETKSILMNGIKIFATANEPDRLSKPIFSRFMKFYLPEYTEQEFYGLTKRLLSKRYGRTDEISERIASIVWHEMGTKDLRDCLGIGKISNTIHEVEETSKVFKTYCKDRIEDKPEIDDDEFIE